MNESLIEQRLTDLERAVEELRRRSASGGANGNWLQRITGSISDQELFLEALEEGRKLRHVDTE
ncbi:MAG: hypothetical protein WD066_00960 [Planctomycetaceae bacterium]